MAITLEDANDNGPVFLRRINNILLISENAVYGTYVTSVSANDQDEGNNGAIMYSVANAPSKLCHKIPLFGNSKGEWMTLGWGNSHYLLLCAR